MADKNAEKEIKQAQAEEEELDLDALDDVTGGSLRDVSKKSTSSINKHTRDNI